MNEKDIVALFRKFAKSRVFIIEKSKHERRQIKTALRDRKLTNIIEFDELNDAWEKLKLTATNLLVFSITDADSEDFLDKIINSTRFKTTPLIIFTGKHVQKSKLYSSANVIMDWSEGPINALKIEQAIIRIFAKGVLDKSLIADENVGLQNYTDGMAAFDDGDYDKAKEMFRGALKQTPDFFEAYIKMAETLIELNDYGPAKKVLMRALELEPDHPTALLLLAQISADTQSKAVAVGVMDETLKKEHNSLNLVIDLGNLALEKGWTDQAIKYFEEARRIDPDLLHVYNRLGIAHSRAGDIDMGIEMYEKALEVDNEDAGVYFNIGMAFNRKGDKDMAIVNFRRALKLDPDMKEPRQMIDSLS